MKKNSSTKFLVDRKKIYKMTRINIQNDIFTIIIVYNLNIRTVSDFDKLKKNKSIKINAYVNKILQYK